jgi:hypothetical protein
MRHKRRQAEAELHKAIKNKGLIRRLEKKFYVNFRFHSSSQFQAADLTCKGRSALGGDFRIGHVYQSNDGGQRSKFVGVIALRGQQRLPHFPNMTLLSGFRLMVYQLL